VGVAAISAAHGIALDQALAAYLNAFAANLVSVGVRLVPLGQTAGLKIMAALHPVIAATSERALRSNLDDLGSAAILSDIASMRHEEQYSRVFRT
jgi:urease accessory protein